MGQTFYLNLYYNNYLGYLAKVETEPQHIPDYLIDDWEINLEAPAPNSTRLIIIDTEKYWDNEGCDQSSFIVYQKDYNSYQLANEKRKKLKKYVREDDYSWLQVNIHEDETYLVYIILESDFKISKVGVL